MIQEKQRGQRIRQQGSDSAASSGKQGVLLRAPLGEVPASAAWHWAGQAPSIAYWAGSVPDPGQVAANYGPQILSAACFLH